MHFELSALSRLSLNKWPISKWSISNWPSLKAALASLLPLVSGKGDVSCFCLLLSLSFFGLNSAVASDFELSQLATELNWASNELAEERKHSQSFSGIGQRASRLARESEKLVDAIARRTNLSNIRSQFKDVSERYADLEDAYWRGSRNGSPNTNDSYVFDQLKRISDIYGDLVSVYSSTQYYEPGPQIHIFPVLPVFGNGALRPPVFIDGTELLDGAEPFNGVALPPPQRAVESQDNRQRYSAPAPKF